MSESIRVKFQGEDLVWLRNDDGSGALAFPEHLDEDGHVNPYDAFHSDSYAHVSEDGAIMRYRKRIGSVGDLEICELLNV